MKLLTSLAALAFLAATTATFAQSSNQAPPSQPAANGSGGGGGVSFFGGGRKYVCGWRVTGPKNQPNTIFHLRDHKMKDGDNVRVTVKNEGPGFVMLAFGNGQTTREFISPGSAAVYTVPKTAKRVLLLVPSNSDSNTAQGVVQCKGRGCADQDECLTPASG